MLIFGIRLWILILPFLHVHFNFLSGRFVQFLPESVENVFPVNPILPSHRSMELIPEFHVEPKVHMEILMMVIMKYAIGLPRLPPISLEVYSRMVNYPVVVNVREKDHHTEPMDRNQNEWTEEPQLHRDKLHRMEGRYGESRRLLISVVELMHIFIKHRGVISPVRQVRKIVLVDKHYRDLEN